MPTDNNKPKRRFTFPVSILFRDARNLLAAINNPLYIDAMKLRLGESIASDVNNRISATKDAMNLQATKKGEAGELTEAEALALHTLARLTAGARRTASQVFRGQTVVLHDEFKVGVTEPQGLDADLLRAEVIANSCVVRAVELKTQGWLASDTATLVAAIATLTGKDQEHEDAILDGITLTSDAIRAANALYDELLRVQNAARLQWPLPPAGVEIASETLAARNKFLLDTFPPRDRSQPDGGAGGTPPLTPAP